MKKFITLVAVAALATFTVTAQQVNSAAFQAKLAKCKADTQNPKKSGKAATWINLGKVCIDATIAPTKTLFTGLAVDMLPMTIGTTPIEVKNGVHVFEWVDVHTNAGKVIAWKVKKHVLDNAYKTAKEALLKAYELDNGQAEKIKTLLGNLVKHYDELGRVSLEIVEYETAIDSYMKIIELQETPIFGQTDPRYYFFAGQLAAFLGTKDAKYFAMGEEFLNKAIKLGYSDEQGNLYYFLFHCYYGQREANKDNLVKAKNALLDGIEKYPRNERIMEGLIQLYTSEDGVGDPADLVGRIDKLLAEKPDNIDLWYARGQVFFKLKNFDECINSFLKINELKPNDYNTNFYLGYFHLGKGDEVNRNFNASADSYTSTAAYNAAQHEVIMTYMKALPWFEKAIELKPDSVDCAEYLKILCFRLRNEPGLMEKYEKYNALFKKLKGIQ